MSNNYVDICQCTHSSTRLSCLLFHLNHRRGHASPANNDCWQIHRFSHPLPNKANLWALSLRRKNTPLSLPNFAFSGWCVLPGVSCRMAFNRPDPKRFSLSQVWLWRVGVFLMWRRRRCGLSLRLRGCAGRKCVCDCQVSGSWTWQFYMHLWQRGVWGALLMWASEGSKTWKTERQRRIHDGGRRLSFEAFEEILLTLTPTWSLTFNSLPLKPVMVTV